MIVLFIGVSLFVAIHLLPSFPSIRNSVVDSLGEGKYKGLYSLMALAGLILMIYGKAEADFVPIWTPPMWTRYIVWVTMLPALILVVAANMPGNIKRFTPHPMMWSVLLWSLAHLTANGDQASIVLFAPLCAFSIIHIFTANARGAKVQTKVLVASTDVKVLAIGLATYAIFAVAHPYLFKVVAFY